MARFQLAGEAAGVYQDSNGNVVADVPFTLSGGPLYAASTGGTLQAVLTTDSKGRARGYLDESSPGVYTIAYAGGEPLTFNVSGGAADDARLDALEDQWINVRLPPYNCAGDGSDDHAGLQLAINDAKSAIVNKSKIWLPATATNIYYSATGLDFTGGAGKHITIEGAGGYGGGTMLAVGYDGRGMDLRVAGGTAGVSGTFRNLWLVQAHASTTGTFLDFSGTAATPPQGWMFENCRIEGANTTGLLIDLQNTVGFLFDHCQFIAGATQVRGLATSAAGVNFSNNHTFTACQFRAYGTISILRPHTAWVFAASFWEGTAAGEAKAISCGTDATMGQRGLYLYSPTFTDATVAGSWVDLLEDSTANAQCQVLIDGAGWGVTATGVKCVRLSGTNFRCLTVTNSSIYHPSAGTVVSIETTNPLAQLVYFGNDVGGGAGALTEISGSYAKPGSLVLRPADDYVGPVLASTWVPFSAGTALPEYVKDALGWVHLRGYIKDGAIPGNVMTLPAGFRPAKTEVFGTSSGAGVHAEIQVGSDGVVFCAAGTNTALSLSGIRFRAA